MSPPLDLNTEYCQVEFIDYSIRQELQTVQNYTNKTNIQPIIDSDCVDMKTYSSREKWPGSCRKALEIKKRT